MNAFAKFLLILIPTVFLALVSCTSGKTTDLSFYKEIIQKNQDNSLTGKLFLVGPFIDSNTVEMNAGCDCCASNLAFLTDSTFVYEFMCLEGDDFLKGEYKRIGNFLIFKFLTPRVVSTYYIGTEKEPTWETRKSEIFFSPMLISELKSKTVLTYSNGTSKEYAVENSLLTFSQYILDLKTEKVWEKLHLR